MNTAASLRDLSNWPTSKPPTPARVWRLLYIARAASVSVTTARATLLFIIFHLLAGAPASQRHTAESPGVQDIAVKLFAGRRRVMYA